MMTVFVYGTLRDRTVLATVLGHDRTESQKAWIDGYGARLVKGEHFPMLRPIPGQRAEGLLLTNLNEDDLKALDAFEGETYPRTPMVVSTETGQVNAGIYIDDGSYDDGGPFVLADWEANHRAFFINSFMEPRGFGKP